MGVITIPNQPLNLLALNELGHNDQLKLCNCMGQKYYQLVTCDDESSVQVKLTESTGFELLADPGFDNALVSGTTTGTAGADLVDAGKNFILEGVLADMIVTNETDSTYSYSLGAAVTVVAISILTGGFVTAEDYSVWRWLRKTGGSFGTWTAAEFLKIDDGKLTKVGTANDVAVKLNFDIQADTYYKITFTIENMVRTTNAAGVKIFIGGTEAIFVNSAGTKTFHYLSETPTDNEIVIQGVDATWDMTNISVKAMTRITIAAREEGETDFAVISTDNITYRQIDVDDDGLSTQNPAVANAKFEWSSLKSGYTCLDGCYELCILDLPSEELVANGDFANGDTGWSFGTEWTLTAAKAVGLSTVVSADPGNILLGTVDLPKGKKYTLTFDVSAYGGGVLLVSMPTNNITLLFSGAPFVGAAGSFTTEIDLTNEAFDETTIQFSLSGTDFGGGPGDMTLDNVSILINADEVNVLTCSEPFVLKSEHTCSMLLKWTNISNAFGINYDQFTLVHSLRVLAKKWQPTWDKIDKKTDTNSLGAISNIYSRTVKKERFTLRELPEYVHDALSIGLEHDSFTVDGTTFVTEDEEYAPEWRKSSLSAPVNVELIESGQLLEKRRCQ